MLYCKLSQPHLTNFSTIENIRFLLDPEFLCADPRASPPDDDMDDVEDITPDEDAAYDLSPLDDDADDATYHRWMVDSQRKNNSLMKRILKAITGGCFVGQEGRTSAQEQTLQQSHPEAKNQLDLPQLEGEYRETGGQLVAPRAGSRTDPPHHLISLCYPSEQSTFLCIHLFLFGLFEPSSIYFHTRDGVK